MRVPLFSVFLFTQVILCPAQESIPLPEKEDGPPALPLEPEPQLPSRPLPDLPKVEMLPRVDPAPGGATPAPKVRVRPYQPPSESSVHGGQFRVHGKIKEQRDLLLNDAEATRRLVMAVLKVDSAFTFPIIIQIRETAALRPGLPQVWSNISQTPDGFRIELNLVPVNNAVPGPLLREELVRCILAEMLLRPHAGRDIQVEEAPPPDWLLYGLLELIDYQALGRPSDTFSTVFRLGHVLSLEDLFATNPRQLDSVSRTIYRSSCCGLLLLLMDQNNGRAHLMELFKILAVMPGDDASAIARCYPNLSDSGNSLGKWWSLQLATMAQPGLDELLSTANTEAELAKILVVQLPALPAAPEKPAAKAGGLGKLFGKKKPEKEAAPADKKTDTPAVALEPAACPLEQYTRIIERKDKAVILNGMERALTKLALRAHPLYRPVVSEYLGLVKGLATGKKEKEAAATLASLATLRGKLKKDMQAVEDYLDWCEATQAGGLSDDFEDYLRAADTLAKPPPPRRDPVSRYMNLMEAEYKAE